MLFLQEIHEVRAGKLAEFEDTYRRGWMPSLAKNPDARLLWYWSHAMGSSHSNQVMTLTALRDGAALEQLIARMETGDLRDWLAGADALRHDVTAKVLIETDWSETKRLDLAGVPTDPDRDHGTNLYGYDTVWPPSLDDYIREAGRYWYKPLTDGTAKIRIQISMPAFLQVGEGTGLRPEVHLIQKRLEPTVNIVHNMLGSDYRTQDKNPDTWFMRGLAVRDQWESRILRTAAWSPLE